MESPSKQIEIKTEQLRAMINESKSKLDCLLSPLMLKNIREESHSCLGKVTGGKTEKSFLILTTKEGTEEQMPKANELDPNKDLQMGCESGEMLEVNEKYNNSESIQTVCGNASVAKADLFLPKELLNEINEIGVSRPVAGAWDARKNGESEVFSHEFHRSKNSIPSVRDNASANKSGYVTNSWKNIVVGDGAIPITASARSDMNLKYFLLDDGPVKLEPDSIAMERWKKCLVGHFVGTKLPFFDVREKLLKQWANAGLKEVSCTDRGFYLLEFHEKNSMDEILNTGHFYVFGRVMVLKKWHKMLKMTREAMKVIPVWVRLYDLPYEFWSTDNLSKVVSKIGRPLYADQATEKLLRISYARICVEIDASKELEKFIKVRYGDEIIEVEVMYQWLPARCEDCKIFGHKRNSCPTRRTTQVANKVSDFAPKKVSTQRTKKDYYQGYEVLENNNKHLKWQAIYMNGTRSRDEITQCGLGKGVNELPVGDKDMEGCWSKSETRKKIVDRHGNVASVKDIKKKNVWVENEKANLKTGNSFNVLAGINELDMPKAKKIVSGTTVQCKRQNVAECVAKEPNDIINCSHLSEDTHKMALPSSDHDVNKQGKNSLQEAMDRLYVIQQTELPNIEGACKDYQGDELEIKNKVKDQLAILEKSIKESGENEINKGLGIDDFEAEHPKSEKEGNVNPDKEIEWFDGVHTRKEDLKGSYGMETPTSKGALSYSDYSNSMSKKKFKKLVRSGKIGKPVKISHDDLP